MEHGLFSQSSCNTCHDKSRVIVLASSTTLRYGCIVRISIDVQCSCSYVASTCAHVHLKLSRVPYVSVRACLHHGPWSRTMEDGLFSRSSFNTCHDKSRVIVLASPTTLCYGCIVSILIDVQCSCSCVASACAYVHLTTLLSPVCEC